MAEPAFPNNPILLVDDDPVARATMADALSRCGHATMETATGEEALELAARRPPALAVLDICLPGISGYEVFRELRRAFGEGLPLVFVSAARTESYDRVAGLLLGADDYFVKPIAPDEFLLRIERLLTRTRPVAPEIAVRLTSREAEVLRLLADGARQEEIGQRLFISRKTVGTHIENILRKLGAHSRMEAVALAYQRDLLARPTPATTDAGFAARAR